MSIVRTKETFKSLLDDSEIKVMALSGKWGTGKSYMWKSTRDDADPGSEIKTALYVSLFGVSKIAELKLKLVQAAAPFMEKKGPAADALKAAGAGLKQLVQGFTRSGTALDEFALLAVPAVVRNKFIVVDDIERKHGNLSIDEVLGFIDDFTQNYGCKILLILNSDQLLDKEIWEKFREKVIDEELRLDTTPSEAFDIAVQLTPSQFFAKIKPAVEVCGLTNIRIIRKIIRIANIILNDHLPIEDDVLNHIIPVTVLMSTIHYKGIEDGPTMDYLLNSGASFHARVKLHTRLRNGEEETNEDKLYARWALLLSRLDITDIDEYGKLLSDYLNSGLLDRTALDTVIDRYRKDHQLAGAQSRAKSFFQLTIWDPNMPTDQVLKLGRSLITDVNYLDCYTVTSLHDHLIEFEGGKEIADQLVTSWIDWLHAKASEPDAESKQFILDNWAGRPLHTSIEVAFKEIQVSLEKPKTLLDVCLYLSESSGWSSTEEEVMRAATANDFQQIILGIQGEQLRTFMLKNLDIYANRHTYEKHFGSAPIHFLQACRQICIDQAGTRWASLIKNAFISSRLGSDLAANE